MPASPQIRCRQIRDSDREAVVDLLEQGFPERPRKYWASALEVLRSRKHLPDLPEFGYLLEADHTVVGVLLLIFNKLDDGPDAPVRCNTSSWYVDPRFQSHAAFLTSTACKLKHVTYLNTSAAKHTWPILAALGFRRYTEGQFASFPALNHGTGANISPLDDSAAHRALPEHALMRAHADAGCLALVGETAEGLLPFVFLRRHIAYAPFGVMQLIYCRETSQFVSYAGPLGRHLLQQGAACVLCDADGPIAGLKGWFFRDKTPRFFKGPHLPHQNDLAFTEMVFFGP